MTAFAVHVADCVTLTELQAHRDTFTQNTADCCGIVTDDEQGALQGDDPVQIILFLSVYVKLR